MHFVDRFKRPRSASRRALVAVLTVVALADTIAGPVHAIAEEKEFLNVSYDPTRELWKEVNSVFVPRAAKDFGVTLDIKQSHGGSSSQARAVNDGLEADVVTLAMWPDTDAIRKTGLIDSGWEDEFPGRSLPYVSTIVFVVRKGNPKGIKDWADIVRPGIEIVTPNPKTSGNGKLSFLAAWGSVLQTGGSEEDAKAFVSKLYKQAPVLDTGARGSTTTFAQKGIGDVQIAWENEAYLAREESGGELEIVYPSISILAEPHVAIVDRNVDRHGTRKIAEAYLSFLYTPEGQQIIARHHYRPNTPDGAALAAKFPAIKLFPITDVAADYDAANARFFNDGKIFDQIYTGGR
ncbi:MAG TPA: sulfate ABC transporter substrate-binding protein [Candidatus Binatia bacterium]|nr:sulfate ABC transporter substrate-binding protein [Candidatus Binatia bacterium]